MSSNKAKPGYAEKVIRALPKQTARDMAMLCLQGWAFTYRPPGKKNHPTSDVWVSFLNGRQYATHVTLTNAVIVCKGRQEHFDTLAAARAVALETHGGKATVV